MFTQDQINLILAAQEQQIKNPARATVNSECAFVKDTISKVDYKLAMEYWKWVCGSFKKDTDLFGPPIVYANELVLAKIDASAVPVPVTDIVAQLLAMAKLD